jgi:hypothetical protein
MTIPIRTKSPRDYDRNLTPTRFLAARFYIWCLEGAIGNKSFPRDYSLFKIELEFRPMNHFGKNVGYNRAPLAERLSRIYGQIVYGRKKKQHELATAVAVEEWTQKFEIKPLIAEKALVDDV